MDEEFPSEDIEECAANCFIRGPCEAFAFVASDGLCYIGDARSKNKIRMWPIDSEASAVVYTKSGEICDPEEKKITDFDNALLPYSRPESLLKDDCPCDVVREQDQWFSNYFFLENDFVGDMVMMDIGCYSDVKHVVVKNSHNGVWADRALKDVAIATSYDNVNWQTEFEMIKFGYDAGTHKDICWVDPAPTKYSSSKYQFDSVRVFDEDDAVRPTIARYVKLQSAGDFGNGPALSYFDVVIGKLHELNLIMLISMIT